MKKLVVLGAGSAGTMVVNRMHKLLDANQWSITVVDQDPIHYYQPGYLFIPFGIYQKQDAIQPKKNYIPNGVKLVMSKIEAVDPEKNTVRLANGETLDYDYLVIATGADIYPDQTPGLAEHEWGRSVHTFYSLDGAVALAETLRTWKGGRLVVNVVENPIKCPVAPLEFLMLADWYFQKRGMRDRVELVYATPLSGVFTKPVANAELTPLLATKNIVVEPDFMIEHVDPDGKKIVSYDEREVPYDLLVSVPLNMGAPMLRESGLGDDLNFVPVNKHTMLSDHYDNIFALGDASNLPTSKAGAVAHYSIDMWSENFVHYTQGHELKPNFDGHTNCFIESGFGKGLLLDFNYAQEPLTGTFPLPVVGPFALLKESRLNHIGKLAFRWMYWNILMRGLTMPLPPTMQMAGKRVPAGA